MTITPPVTDLTCGVVGHDDDCLCDVQLPDGPPPAAGNVTQALRELVEIHGDAVVSSMRELAAEDEHREAWTVARASATSRLSGSDTVAALAQQGLNLDEIALHLGEDTETVASTLCLRDEDIPTVLMVESALRSTERPVFAEIAKQLGCEMHTVRNLARRLGIKSAAEAQVAEGGGRRFGPEVYGEIANRTRRGERPTRIANEMSLHRNTVRRIVKILTDRGEL